MEYWGYHLIIDCGGCDAKLMADYDNVDTWIRNLVKDIDMQPRGEPRIEYTAAEFPDKAGFTVCTKCKTMLENDFEKFKEFGLENYIKSNPSGSVDLYAVVRVAGTIYKDVYKKWPYTLQPEPES